jgi:hypothetical protein
MPSFKLLFTGDKPMKLPSHTCPDCHTNDSIVPSSRRKFLKSAGAAALTLGASPLLLRAAETAASTPESIVKLLHDSLSDTQKQKICFAWDHQDPKLGLLRTRVANNWQVTDPVINTNFFTKDQQAMIRQIFEGIYNPEWHARIDKQLTDDAGGYGEDQSIAIFGTPGTDKYEFVMTGRHMTVRCDGNSAEHVAFGGPIFYGHAADTFNEGPSHPGNVFWPQAVAANKVFEMLDGQQRKLALVEKLPVEQESGFRGTSGGFPGIPLTDCTNDQRELVQQVLAKLIEPYRQSDQDEVAACLKAQGGLDQCSLAFYRDGDIGNDGVWDCWRLEGPSFVWYFRGSPHVHVWVNVADNPNLKLNA